MKKSHSSRLGVEQFEDRLNPSGSPFDVYMAVHQVKMNTEILKFVTNDDLVNNPFTQPYVGAFLDHVHLTNQSARDEITDFLNNLMSQHAGNPLTANYFVDHVVSFGNVLNEAVMGIAYAESFAGILNTPLTSHGSSGTPDNGGTDDPFAPPSPPPPSPPSPPPPPALADLSITNSDGNSTFLRGTTITYTMTARNNGPTAVTGARVVNDLPANITNVSWTAAYSQDATGAASGTGDIDTLITLGNGSIAIFTITGTVSATANGNLTTIATITAPSGITDNNLANNTATDVNTPTIADMQVSITDDSATYTPGSNITYTLVARNNGPSLSNATLNNLFLAGLANVSWTAVYGNGSSGAASGTGNISTVIKLAAGGNATFTINAEVLGNATGNLTTTANLTVASTAIDSDLTNNTTLDINLPDTDPIDLTSDAGMTFVMPDTTTGFSPIGNGVMIRDMIVGTGDVANPSSTATLYYTGWLNANGTMFETSRPDSTTFNLSGTIAGFRNGIDGMQLGGIRQILIPADQGYGNAPNGDIPANSVLVFEVKIVALS